MSFPHHLDRGSDVLVLKWSPHHDRRPLYAHLDEINREIRPLKERLAELKREADHLERLAKEAAA